jgi:dsRNA-specific ribonuclease
MNFAVEGWDGEPGQQPMGTLETGLANGTIKRIQNPTGHVTNLLEQAAMFGLLPPTSSATAFPIPPLSNQFMLPYSGPIFVPGNTNGFGPQNGSHVAQGRKRSRERQFPWKNANRSDDTKRRKLNNYQSPQKKKGKKGSGADSQYIDSLISEALSVPNDHEIQSLNTIPKFPIIQKPENYPPPLPPMHDKMIEQMCFTHRSYVHETTPKSSESVLSNYERLEFFGDSYLNYCVTRILYLNFPQLREGNMSSFRSQLVCNENIRHYAIMYGFQDRLLLGDGANKEDTHEALKRVADTFEAYIGGILVDQPEDGEKVIFRWLSEVTAPQIKEAEKVAKVLLNLNRNAKQELYSLLDAEKAPAPEYRTTKMGDTNTDYEVACIVQGKEIGRGIGKNKNEAGTRAAMQALARLKATPTAAKTAGGGAVAYSAETGVNDGCVNGAVESEEMDGKDKDELKPLASGSHSESEGEIIISSDESVRGQTVA